MTDRVCRTNPDNALTISFIAPWPSDLLIDRGFYALIHIGPSLIMMLLAALRYFYKE